MTCNTMLLEKPTVVFSGESRYMTRLWVSVNVEPREELRHFYPSQSITADSLYHQEITNKIRAALKTLTVRKEHVIVQFWSPRVAGKHQLLTTKDQPFGLGVVSDELCSYRRDSEDKVFLVDKDHEDEEDVSPPARVFRRGLPEWTPDLTNYKTKDFPQQECAIRCNLHGYLALPVSDPTTGLRVGVLELLMSSKLEDFAYEVEYIHVALKTWNLTSPQAFEVFDGPALNVSNEHSVNELDKIFNILKRVCDTHRLPLAQTWIMSRSTSYFAHEDVLEESCSFNTRCFGKICMSTGLPYNVRDVNMWPFIDASKKRHLEKSRGVAGRAMSSHGSCFCLDVTELDEEEYPLVHNARMSKLTGCFAIFLHGVEGNNDYVLEFFLDGKCVKNLVNTLKQSIEADSGFELGDVSTMEIISPPMHLSLNETDSSDSDSVVTDAFGTDHANVSMETVCDNFTSTVMVNVAFNNSIERFAFSLFSEVSELEERVAKRFKLEGQGLQLKYIDEDDDLILVCDNEALKFALDASGSNNSINLICSKITL